MRCTLSIIIRPVNLSNREPTPLAQPLAKTEQQVHQDCAQDHEACKEADTAVDTDAAEHGPREQDRRKCEQAPGQTVCREDTGGVSRVDVGDVEQDRLRDEVRAEDGKSKTDCAC